MGHASSFWKKWRSVAKCPLRLQINQSLARMQCATSLLSSASKAAAEALMTLYLLRTWWRTLLRSVLTH